MKQPRVLREALVAGGRRRLPQETPPQVASPSPLAVERLLGAADEPSRTHAQVDHHAERLEVERAEARKAGLEQGLADAEARISRELETRWKKLHSDWEQTERRRADEWAAKNASLDQVLAQSERAVVRRMREVEQQAVLLAFEALCKVCGSLGASDAGRVELISQLIGNAMEKLHGQTWLAIHLSARDYEHVVTSEWGRGLAGRHSHVRFVVDVGLEPAGAILESDHGRFDVGLFTQLERLRELWGKSWNEGAPPASGQGIAESGNA